MNAKLIVRTVQDSMDGARRGEEKARTKERFFSFVS